jgi:hypothetical protein
MRKLDTTLNTAGQPATYDDYFGTRAHGSADAANREISARLASAQFAITAQAAPAHLHNQGQPAIPALRTASDERTPTIPLVRSLALGSQPPASQMMPNIAGADAVTLSAAMTDDPDLPLPATWYNRPDVPVRRGLSPERHAFLIRSSAAVCLATAAGLLFWLSSMGQPPALPQTAAAQLPSSSLVSSFAPPAPMAVFGRAPGAETPSQDQISTAQILAVAERFVATGDVLAARAMLQERAGSGEPRALFALAETYDPNMLASWAAKDAEASVTYARFLYEAARRGGVAESQTRLEALK